MKELGSATLVEDVASKAETIQAVVCDLTDNVIELESKDPVVHESIKEEAVSVVAHGVGSGEKIKVAVCRHHTLQSS